VTVEIEYERVDRQTFELSQLDMARQIASNRAFQMQDIERVYSGRTLIVRVEADLQSSVVDDILLDIGEHMNDEATYVETRPAVTY